MANATLVQVDNATPAGTAANPLVTSIPVPAHVDGAAAPASAVSGNPVSIGVLTKTAQSAASGNGASNFLIGTSANALVVMPYSVPEVMWMYAAATGGIVNTTTAVTIVASAGAGIRNYLTSITIATDALGGATEFIIQDGAAGAILWRIRLQITALPVQNILLPSALRGSAATLIQISTVSAVTGGVYFCASGFQSQ